MNKAILKQIEKEINDLKVELDQIQILDSYPGAIPPEWQDDILKLINIKRRIPRITKLLTNCKIL